MLATEVDFAKLLNDLSKQDNLSNRADIVLVTMYTMLGSDRAYQIFDTAKYELPPAISNAQRDMLGFILAEAKKEVKNFTN